MTVLDHKSLLIGIRTYISEAISTAGSFHSIIFEQHLFLLEESAYSISKAYGKDPSFRRMSTDELQKFKSEAEEATAQTEAIYNEIQTLIGEFNSELTNRLNNAITSHNKVVDQLSRIDSYIASWPNRNLALVANHLGYPDGTMVTNNLYNLGGPDPALDEKYPLPLYGYLACLGDRYSDYFFQALEYPAKNSQKLLTLMFFKSEDVSQDTLAARVMIGKSAYGYYVADVQEHESGMNKESQRDALVSLLISQCFRKLNS